MVAVLAFVGGHIKDFQISIANAIYTHGIFQYELANSSSMCFYLNGQIPMSIGQIQSNPGGDQSVKFDQISAHEAICVHPKMRDIPRLQVR